MKMVDGLCVDAGLNLGPSFVSAGHDAEGFSSSGVLRADVPTGNSFNKEGGAENIGIPRKLKKEKKVKPVMIDTVEGWEQLLLSSETGQSKGVNIQEIMKHQVRRDSLISQIGASLRNGLLSTSAPSVRLRLLNMLDKNWEPLCEDVESNRVRMLYETIRDNTSNSKVDSPQTLVELNSAALVTLTNMMIQLNMPHRDPRMVKFHIEKLNRILTKEVSLSSLGGNFNKSVIRNGDFSKTMNSCRVAIRCLTMLETAFPTLLSPLAVDMLSEAEKPDMMCLRGFPMTILATRVLSNLASEYLRQKSFQEEIYCAEPSCDTSDIDDIVSDADVYRPDSETDVADSKGISSGVDKYREREYGELDQALDSTFRHKTLDKSLKEIDSWVGGQTASPRETISGGLGRSTVSFETLNAQSGSATSSICQGSTRVREGGSENGRSGSNAWTASSTPRSGASISVPILKESPAARCTIPEHFRTGSGNFSEVSLEMTPFAERKFQEAVCHVLKCVKRMDAASIGEVSKHLGAIFQVSKFPPNTLWPLMDDLIRHGSTPVLEFVLETHDAMPELFEGWRPCLLEKILYRSNDQSYSVNHRQTCLRWIIRQHATQCYNGGELLLADCWVQLLPQDEEPLQIVSLKVKSISSCLSSGIGDIGRICDAVCLCQAYVDPKTKRSSAKHLNSFSYALRLILNAADRMEETGANSVRAKACLIRSIIQSVVLRPSLVPAVNDFLESCNDEFSLLFLGAFESLLGSLDGQFEILRERHEDVTLDESNPDLSARVKAALLSRASSVSGMIRGLSFKLGRRSSSTTGIGYDLHRTASLPSKQDFDVKKIRSSVSAAFQKAYSSQDQLPQRSARRETDVESLLSDMEFEAGPVSALEEAPPLPPDVDTIELAEKWLTTPTTWSHLVIPMMRHDLMEYRGILHRLSRTQSILPIGTLRSLANYCWQYQSYHPSHSLSTKATGSACLAIVQTAALTHLPLSQQDSKRTLRQLEVSESIMAVLDALQEGFPCDSVSKRCDILVRILSDEKAWHADRTSSTLALLLGGYIDAALE